MQSPSPRLAACGLRMEVGQSTLLITAVIPIRRCAHFAGKSSCTVSEKSDREKSLRAITACVARVAVIAVPGNAVESCATRRDAQAGASVAYSDVRKTPSMLRAGTESARAQCNSRALSTPLGTSLRSTLFSCCNVQRASANSLRSRREALASDVRALIESSAACRRTLRSERSSSRIAAP